VSQLLESAMAELESLLGSARIEGLDIPDALSRMNGSASIFMRIIHTFLEKMPGLLARLRELSASDMAEYSICVHGIKGSCYGIGAQACGDAAFALELASKAGDGQKVASDTEAFIDMVGALLAQLADLEAAAKAATDGAQSVRPAKAAPDKDSLAALLLAVRDYDAARARRLLDDLGGAEYENDGELITWLRDRLDEYAWDDMTRKLESLLT
jgi:HPt (histidine-containing phosphotransfer) domain-containing protein